MKEYLLFEVFALLTNIWFLKETCAFWPFEVKKLQKLSQREQHSSDLSVYRSQSFQFQIEKNINIK